MMKDIKKTLILKLTCILGFFDLYHMGWKYKIYSALVLILHIATTIFSNIMYSNEVRYKDNTTVLTRTRQVLVLIPTTTLVVAIISLVFWNENKLMTVLGIINQFDTIFFVSPDKSYIFLFIVLLETVSLSILEDCLVSGSVILKISEYIYGQGIQKLSLSMLYNVRFFLFIQIARRFRILNDLLERTVENGQLNSAVVILKTIEETSVVQTVKNWKKIRRISKFHNDLCQSLDFMNSIFGLVVVFELIFCIAFFTQSTMYIIVQNDNRTNINCNINEGTVSTVVLIIVCVSM